MSSLDYIVVCKAEICKLSFSQLGGSLIPIGMGMVNTRETIPKLRLRLPPFHDIKINLTDYPG
jgi:hypothetical protein